MNAHEQQSPSNVISRLSVLRRHSELAEKRASAWNWGDDLSHLSGEKRASWKRILSSVATTETLEESIMGPIALAFGGDEDSARYLAVHAADEARHYNLLTRYLKNTFGYVKSRRTLMDQVLYDRVIPGVARVFRSKPTYGLALLHAYEKFSIVFYERLIHEARQDGAQSLLTILTSIEKDERRHIAGMEQLLRLELSRTGGASFTDRAAMRAILNLMLVDVDMRPWALHNREVREHLVRLGFDPLAVTSAARATAEDTLSLVASLSGTRGKREDS